MLKIAGNRISLTRGDSAYIEIKINNNEGSYQLLPSDNVRLQIRTKVNNGDLLLEASIQNGKIYVDESEKIVWHIIPEDTRMLGIGNYRWDAQLEMANGDVFTFITDGIFQITNEVTYDD